MIPPYPNLRVKTYQLFNIKQDPEQKNDLAEQNPKLLRQMMMCLERLKRETGKMTDY